MCALHDVFPDQWFSAAEYDEHFAGASLLGDVVQHSEEVFAWHVGREGSLPAVASAVSAMDVAAHSAFPEQLPERMFFAETFVQESGSLECHGSSDA